MLAAVVATLFTSCGGECQGGSGPSCEPTVGPAGGRVDRAGGWVSLDFPAGALSQDITVVVTPTSNVPTDPRIVDGTTYVLAPEGLTFSLPVKLTIRYEPSGVAASLPKSSLRLSRLVSGEWQDVVGSSADTTRHEVFGSLDGFSTYGVRGLASATTCLTTGWTLFWPICVDDRSALGQDYAQFDFGSTLKYHSGIDIFAPPGTPVQVAIGQALTLGFPSEVVKIQENDVGCAGPNTGTCADHGYGNTVFVRHLNGALYTQYSHLESIESGLKIACGVIAKRTICNPPVSVVPGTILGTVGCTRYGLSQCVGFASHLHFETKTFSTLGTGGDDVGPYFGYAGNGTKGPAQQPDYYGYSDPILWLHDVTPIMPDPILYPEILVQVLAAGAGASLRVGPGAYRTLRTVVNGETFLRVRSAGPSTTPSCSKGWYQVSPPDRSEFPDLSRVRVGSPTPSTIPEAWVCSGDAGQDWITPISLSVSLTATPPSVSAGQSSTLSWSSTNATSCTAGWTSSTASSGSQVVSPAVTTAYSITCTGAGGSATASATVTVTLPVYTISTSSSPSNGGSTSGGGTYATSSSVTVTASAASGYAFVNWTENGSQVTSSARYTFTASANRSLVANFSANPVLTVTGGGTGNGSVTSSVGGINCSITAGSVSGNCSASFNSGTSVTLTASPVSGHTFAGWSGACSGIGACQVTMTQVQSVTASFTVGASIVFTQLAAGVNHTCGLTSGGEAYCWGSNFYGQLGDGTKADRVTPRLVQGGAPFVELAAGFEHTCGLTSAGQAWCWGSRALGNGTVTEHLTPTPVLQGSILFVELTAGDYHTCGRTSGGQAHCWGLNYYGQLGDGTAQRGEHTTPTPVLQGSILFAELTAGEYHTCGRTSAGQAYCWGFNSSGQLGDDNTVDRFTPTPVLQGNILFAELTAGEAHTCGRTSAGKGYCWGSNSSGQLGDNTQTQRLTPTPVLQGGVSLVELTAGEAHTCGRTSAGQAYCWGDGLYGQLGDGVDDFTRVFPRLTPRPVLQGNILFVALAAGLEHTCGWTSGGQAYCWGNNFYGQLGDNTTEERFTPVPVKSP